METRLCYKKARLGWPGRVMARLAVRPFNPCPSTFARHGIVTRTARINSRKLPPKHGSPSAKPRVTDLRSDRKVIIFGLIRRTIRFAMNIAHAGTLDYVRIAAHWKGHTKEELIACFNEHLPFHWRDAYLKMTLRPTDIVKVIGGIERGFVYIYDHHPEMQPPSANIPDTTIEPRLVCVYRISAPQKLARDDYRLKGWVGPTGKMFGAQWDKGHFIAHSLGGAVDGTELNVFVQNRRFNRGWSAEGKTYRKMEKYCAAHPRTFCFSRPFYNDQSAKPAFIEFGLLKADNELWIECFDNR